jgi:hypothetical protein
MKIDFKNYDLEQFDIKQDMFCGNYATLIIPKMMGCNWTKKNRIFRSSIWDFEGNLISASFPKFVNFGENPEHFPTPNTLNECRIIDKIDGSLCIIDYCNNQLSMRTRGTLSVNKAENVSDFYECIEKYPLLKEWLISHNNYSLLCEITTQNQKIVLDYGNIPDFWLIGAVDKNDYSLMTQENLDSLSKLIGVKRPEYYKFTSINDLLESVKKLIGKEGCCLYSKKDQEIHKIKSERYLVLHHLKSELSNIEKILDVWLNQGMPDYSTFYEFISTTFDFELAESCRGHISNICDAAKEITLIVDSMKEFLKTRVMPLSTRRDQAKVIIDSYGPTSRASFMFAMLDGKELDKEQYKKLAFQCLKK